MKYVVTDEDVELYKRLHSEGMEKYNEDRLAAGEPLVYRDAIDAGTKYALESFAKTLGEPVAVPDDELLECALDANDMCRSAFQVVERVAIEHGTPFAGTNFGGLHEQLKKSLERQHKVLKPYREAMLSAAPHHPTTEKGCE